MLASAPVQYSKSSFIESSSRVGTHARFSWSAFLKSLPTQRVVDSFDDKALAVFDSFPVPSKPFCVRENITLYIPELLNFLSSTFSSLLYCKLCKRIAKTWRNLLPFECHLYYSPFLQFNRTSSDLNSLARTVSFMALSRCTLFPLSKHNTSFFYTMPALATFEHVLPRTLKRCRAVCTARVLTAVQRRRIIVHCFAEMKRTVSVLGPVSHTFKKSKNAQL